MFLDAELPKDGAIIYARFISLAAFNVPRLTGTVRNSHTLYLHEVRYDTNDPSTRQVEVKEFFL